MKCIKKGEEIKRVKDIHAFELIEAGEGWVYCPKSEWKLKNGKSKKDETQANSNS